MRAFLSDRTKRMCSCTADRAAALREAERILAAHDPGFLCPLSYLARPLTEPDEEMRSAVAEALTIFVSE